MHTTNYQTQEQRNQIVNEYLSSQLTRKEFCKQKKISLSSLYRWKTEYEQMQTEPLLFLPLSKQQTSTVSIPEQQGSSHHAFCSEEIRIEMGDLHIFIREQSSLPLLKLLLEEVKHLAL